MRNNHSQNVTTREGKKDIESCLGCGFGLALGFGAAGGCSATCCLALQSNCKHCDSGERFLGLGCGSHVCLQVIECMGSIKNDTTIKKLICANFNIGNEVVSRMVKYLLDHPSIVEVYACAAVALVPLRRWLVSPERTHAGARTSLSSQWLVRGTWDRDSPCQQSDVLSSP